MKRIKWMIIAITVFLTFGIFLIIFSGNSGLKFLPAFAEGASHYALFKLRNDPSYQSLRSFIFGKNLVAKNIFPKKIHFHTETGNVAAEDAYSKSITVYFENENTARAVFDISRIMGPPFRETCSGSLILNSIESSEISRLIIDVKICKSQRSQSLFDGGIETFGIVLQDGSTKLVSFMDDNPNILIFCKESQSQKIASFFADMIDTFEKNFCQKVGASNTSKNDSRIVSDLKISHYTPPVPKSNPLVEIENRYIPPSGSGQIAHIKLEIVNPGSDPIILVNKKRLLLKPPVEDLLVEANTPIVLEAFNTSANLQDEKSIYLKPNEKINVVLILR